MKIVLISFAIVALFGANAQSSRAGSAGFAARFETIATAIRPAVPTCRREALSIKEGETEAAMGGVRQTPYTLTNTSSSPCTLEGYPSVELVNRQGKVVRRSKKQQVDEAAESVTLDPGKTAWFNLNFNAGGAGRMGKPCPTYKIMKIVTPGGDRPLALRTEITSCAGSTFEVGPVRAGVPNQ